MLAAAGAAAGACAAVAAALVPRRRTGGYVAGAAAGVLVALVAALAVDDLTASQIPWTLPAPVARSLAASCLGLGAVVAAAAALALRTARATGGPGVVARR